MLCHKKKPFEFLDPDLKALDPGKLLKKDGYKEKVKMKTNLERLRTNDFMSDLQLRMQRLKLARLGGTRTRGAAGSQLRRQ